jgi:hypothetical protein
MKAICGQRRRYEAIPHTAYQCAVLFLWLALCCASRSSSARSADDVQTIKCGSFTFYIPVAWMKRIPAHTPPVIAYMRPKGEITEPQPTPIEVNDVTLRPQADWTPYSRKELPELIMLSCSSQPVTRYRPPPVDVRPPIEPDSGNADSYGFISRSGGQDKQGFLESFRYKGHQNDLGQALVVVSDNSEYPSGHHYPSSVDISPQLGLRLLYRFDNTEFPESTWWTIYQKTLALIDLIEKPK